MKKLLKKGIKILIGGLALKLISVGLSGDTSVESMPSIKYENSFIQKDTFSTRQSLKSEKNYNFYEFNQEIFSADGTGYIVSDSAYDSIMQ